MVGDRDMTTSARIQALNQLEDGHSGPRTPTGGSPRCRAPAIKKLMADDGPLQLSLFDQQDLAEITSEDFPGERLIACRNSAQHDEACRPYRSFRGLLGHLATLTRNQVRFARAKATVADAPPSRPAPEREAFDLIGAPHPAHLEVASPSSIRGDGRDGVKFPAGAGRAGLGSLPRDGRGSRLRAGMWGGGWVRAARDAGAFGMRTRFTAWRWGLDLRVAHCCLEHAGQYSGPCARRPGPPGSPPFPISPSIGGSGEQTAGNRRRRNTSGSMTRWPRSTWPRTPGWCAPARRTRPGPVPGAARSGRSRPG